jgi:peroxiredoxin
MLLTRLPVLFLPPCVDRRLPLYPKALNAMKIKQLSVNIPSCQQAFIVK